LNPNYPGHVKPHHAPRRTLQIDRGDEQIQHENAPLTLANEVRALASIRAPLKVIITYALNDYRRPDQIVRDLPGKIASELLSIDSLLGEDSSTQYLFLIGKESPEREIQWWSMAFAANESLDGKEFLPTSYSN